MKLVMQPEASNLCGQACVATIAGVSLEQAIDACEKRGKTSTRHLIAGLRRLGLKPDYGCYRMHKTSSFMREVWDKCTLIVKFRNKACSHWVVRHEGKFYDPAMGVCDSTPKYLEAFHAKATSFLVVAGREKLEGVT